jgi:glycosyltransferase involved in cell wall biosynthesis
VNPSRIARRDPEALGQAIADVLAEGRRSNGREIVVQELSESQMVQQIMGVYQRALA